MLRPIDARLARLRVPVGAIVALAVLVFSHPTWKTLAVGGGLSICGEALRIWASGFIRKNTLLATGGAYRYTRNPLYLGNLITGIGVVVAAGTVWTAICYLGYYAVFYAATIRREADALSELFGSEFDLYRAKVPALLPRLTAPPDPGPTVPFTVALVWQNREYRALIAVAVVYAILVIRIVWPWP